MRFVDWFAGIGGFRLGLEQAGHSCVFSCEINPFSRKVYAARFGAPPEAEDVTRVEAEEIPQADLWTAGFPCQDVSTAGLRGGLGASRSGLVWTLLDLAAVARPKWILLENVPGLLQFRDGFGELLARLDDLGYVGAWRVLDAQNFGVPQRRRRVFILAGRAGECRPDEVLLEPESVRGRAPSRRNTRSGAAEGAHGGAGGGVASNRETAYTLDTNSQRAARVGDNLVAFSITPEGGQGTDIRATEVDLCPAINATGVRRLTPRECERLQGFPDDWTLVAAEESVARGRKAFGIHGGGSSDSQRYKAIGNSVAVPVIRWIGERLK